MMTRSARSRVKYRRCVIVDMLGQNPDTSLNASILRSGLAGRAARPRL